MNYEVHGKYPVTESKKELYGILKQLMQGQSCTDYIQSQSLVSDYSFSHVGLCPTWISFGTVLDFTKN